MFNLSEQWKQAYDNFLEEEYNKIDEEFTNTFTEMEIATQEVINTYNILEEYFNAIALVDNLTEEINDETRDISSTIRSATEALIKNRSLLTSDFNKASYESIPSAETVERISDMKFPKNIIFFIKQIINWIRRFVVYFIEKIKNIIRVIFGRPEKELDKDYLKLRLYKTKKLETMKGVSQVNAGKESDPIKIYKLDPKDVKEYTALKEEFLNESFFEGLFKEIKDDKPIEKVPMYISIDVSKDLIILKEQVQHFLDLYEYALGSNNEHLFKTEDLEIILKIFKDTIRSIKDGTATTYEVGSQMAEFSAIDSNRVKDNLVKTNINLENLKKAYMQTSAKIQDIANIISHKQLLLLSQSGVISYKTVSSGTLAEMERILDIVRPKVKEAAGLEKDLERTQKKYNQISAELQKMQQILGSFSNLTYTTVYQRRVTDLFNSARYMSQTISLRLTAIGLYIKALKEVCESIALLARINEK